MEQPSAVSSETTRASHLWQRAQLKLSAESVTAFKEPALQLARVSYKENMRGNYGLRIFRMMRHEDQAEEIIF